MGNYLSSEEKKKTPVGRGINLLSGDKLCLDNARATLLDFDKLPVLREYGTDNDSIVKTENSKYELANSVSTSIKFGLTLFKVSASIKYAFESETSSSTEKAYTAMFAICKREKQYLDPNLEDKSAVLKSALQPGFATALNGPGELAPDELFKKYGTHVILEGGMGGFVNAFCTTDKSATQTTEEIRQEMGASVGDYVNFEASHAEKSSTGSMTAHGMFKADFQGGSGLDTSSAAGFAKTYFYWQNSLQNSVRWEFCYLPDNGSSLLPIWKLASSAARRNQLRRAYKNALKNLSSPVVGTDYFLDEIDFTSAKKDDDAHHALYAGETGIAWNFIDQDLAEGTGGNYIYLQYRMKPLSECHPEGPIRHILLLHRMNFWGVDGPLPIIKKEYDSIAKKKGYGDSYHALPSSYYNTNPFTSYYPDWAIKHCDYIRGIYKRLDNGQEAVINLPDQFGKISPYHVIPQDLNEGASTYSKVYLCYTRGSDHSPVTSIGAYLDANCPSNEWEIATWAGARDIADLNFNTRKHKKSIHLIMKHAANNGNDLTGMRLCDLDGLENDLEEEEIKGWIHSLAFGRHNVGHSVMPFVSGCDWKTENTEYVSGSGRTEEFVYNTCFVPESTLKETSWDLVTNLLVVKASAPVTWKKKLFKDQNGIMANYYLFNQNINLSGDGTYCYLCYTYDGQYKPLNRFEAATKQQLNANASYYKQFEQVRIADTVEAADLLGGKEGLYLFFKRDTAFRWEQYPKVPHDTLKYVDKFVTDILIGNYPELSDAKHTKEGYSLVGTNLNKDAAGNYIYIRYKAESETELTNSGRAPITNLLLVQSNKEPEWSTAMLKDGAGKEALYIRIASDLNKNAGGSRVYLCWTTDTVYKPLKGISAVEGYNTEIPKGWEPVTWKGSREKGDVNLGTSGKKIYLIQQR